MVGLIRIIIHTLAAHAHVCDRYSRPTFAARSRDMSQISLGGNNEEEEETAAATQEVDEEPITHEEEAEEEEEEEVKEQEQQEKAEAAAVDKLCKVMLAEEPEQHLLPKLPEMANLFEFLPKPSSAAAGGSGGTGASKGGPSAPLPTDSQLTTQGLPEGWAMQLMRSGRTLFIDNKVSFWGCERLDFFYSTMTSLLQNQLTTWIDPRTGRPAEVKNHEGYFFESPPSPLSLMDVITLGSPVPIDRATANTATAASAAAATGRSESSSSSAVTTVTSPLKQVFTQFTSHY